MLLKLKNYFKYKTPHTYDKFRDAIFPLYLKVRSDKLNKFKTNRENKVIKNINFADVKYKLVLDKANGFVDEEIYWKGVYEEEVMLSLKKQIIDTFARAVKGSTSKSDVLFLDIGSNIGQELIFAMALARKSNLNNFYSIGFEPIKKLCDQITQSIQANNFNIENVKVMNYALGDREQELTLKTPVINVGGSSLVRNESNTVGEIREEKIFVKKGDDVISNILKTQASPLTPLPKRGEQIQNTELKLIMKIDVEGFEYEVINGLSETIKKYKPTIILEYSPAFYIKNSAMGDRSQMGIELLKIMVDENYTMEIIDIGEFKNKIYKGQEIINWGQDFKGEQANLLLYKV